MYTYAAALVGCAITNKGQCLSSQGRQAGSPSKAARVIKSLHCGSPIQHYSCSNRMYTGLCRSSVVVVSQSLEFRAVMY
jgi:hypothetical protein